MSDAVSSGKRFLFVGGGTGGHLAPAVGLAEALHQRGHRIQFLRSGRPVELDYLDPAWDLQNLAIDRTRLPKAMALVRASWRVWRCRRRFRPDLVISVGGMAGAVALAAWRPRRLVLLEGNRVAGKAVRWMQPFATATLTLFSQTEGRLRRPWVMGPVRRRALQAPDRSEARRRLGLPAQGPILLLMGGSQGAMDLNRFVQACLPDLAERGWAVLALTGSGKEGDLAQQAERHGLTAVVRPQLREMGWAYQACDLVFCRGGAATVAELCLFRKPAVVVPYPHHKDRQQERNVEEFQDGILLLKPLDERDRLQFLKLLDDDSKRTQMAEALAEKAPADGLAKALDFLEALAAGRE